MNHRDFCYWLKGFFNIYKASHDTLPELSHAEVLVIYNSLEVVFMNDLQVLKVPTDFKRLEEMARTK